MRRFVRRGLPWLGWVLFLGLVALIVVVSVAAAKEDDPPRLDAIESAMDKYVPLIGDGPQAHWVCKWFKDDWNFRCGITSGLAAIASVSCDPATCTWEWSDRRGYFGWDAEARD